MFHAAIMCDLCLLRSVANSCISYHFIALSGTWLKRVTLHACGHLPLKHLSIRTDLDNMNRLAWFSAPTTLTRLTFNVVDEHNRLTAVLPTSITHLQLLGAHCEDAEHAATALPWLESMVTGCRILLHNTSRWNNTFSKLTRLTSLQSLDVCVFDVSHDEHLDHQQALSRFPELAKIAERGIYLSVMNEEDQAISMFGCSRDENRYGPLMARC